MLVKKWVPLGSGSLALDSSKTWLTLCDVMDSGGDGQSEERQREREMSDRTDQISDRCVAFQMTAWSTSHFWQVGAI